ncbi:MAG TPA: ABC transporter ATP-binding protein [Tepidisphaeraceae bacterium]|jgi:spermidine/putrescine transport system ATP-binding protein
MVEFISVTKRWGSFTAVDDVSLKIRAGEFLTLLGPSGCGKTTMLRMISGFEHPTSGRVLLDGRDVTGDPPYRREVNQVFQSYALFPHLTVRENIEFGLKMKKVERDELRRRVDEAVRIVALAEYQRRRPHQLSGGQRQRVALARAIVNRPKVLLLDEPLSALDASLRHTMQIELKRLQAKLGITFVFVTHDQEEALTMSDRIAVINHGRVEQIDSVQDIYHRPRTRFVAEFIGKANVIDAAIVGGGVENVRVNVEAGLELDVCRDGAAVRGDRVRVAVRPEKINVTAHRPAGVNAFEVTVEEELFRGAIDELCVRTAGGTELTVLVANEGRMEAAVHRGDRVWCQIHPEDAVLIED